MKHRFIQELKIIQKPGGWPTLFLDGVEFPYYVAPDPQLTPFGNGVQPGFTVTLLAEKVVVDVEPFGVSPAAQPPKRRWPWSRS